MTAPAVNADVLVDRALNRMEVEMAEVVEAITRFSGPNRRKNALPLLLGSLGHCTRTIQGLGVR